MDEIVSRLASCDELQNWGNLISDVTGVQRKDVFEKATPIWVSGMINEG